MSAVDFEVLKLIPKMLEKMESMQSELVELKQQLNPKYDLTKQSGVLKYLEISESTLAKYRKNGTFREGYHYHRELKQSKSIITYVSGAIEEFKKDKIK
ncbi:hypothetical protein CRU92_06415 [Arcobacter sp. FW59]|nr:hypothetical protein CRU92_06415 [Arcobacter sp. FW59]